MIEVEITEEMIRTAEVKAAEMGKLKKSITDGEGNIAGFLGEEIANGILGGTIENTKDYDIVHDGLRYDVKTKRCTSPPKPWYECSVAAFNVVQKCDRYVFVRIQQNKETKKFEQAWVLGWFDKDKYFLFANKLKKGQRDGDNWFKVKADCYNFPIEALNSIEVLEDS